MWKAAICICVCSFICINVDACVYMYIHIYKIYKSEEKDSNFKNRQNRWISILK